MSGSPHLKDLLAVARNRVRILILGPYRTQEAFKCETEKICLNKLDRLKAFLIEKGFPQTRLVIDWMDEEEVPPASFDIHFREKSFYYIDNWADIILFVFLREGDNLSVSREWGHMVESVREKCERAVVLRQKEVDLGSLIRGDIERERVYEYHFEQEAELQDFAFSGCFNILYGLIQTSQQ